MQWFADKEKMGNERILKNYIYSIVYYKFSIVVKNI